MPASVRERHVADYEALFRPARASVQTGSYTLARADANTIVEVDSASATVITVPTDAVADFPEGTVIGIYQQGTGTVSVIPSGGVALRSSTGLTGSRSLVGQYAEASIRKRGSNDWVLVGDLS